MITPKQTSSGTWSAQIRMPDGSRTRLYGESKAAVLEQYYRIQRKGEDRLANITLDDALLRYIIASDSLSPNTIREYRKMMNTRFDILKDKKISLITSEDVRLLVSRWAKQGLSAKSIRNAYSLFLSTMKFFLPGVGFVVSLPRQTNVRRRQADHVPSAEEVKIFLEYAEGTACEVPVMLAAYCGMRLGEIAALHPEDLNGNVLHIQRSMARDFEGIVSEKSPKTKAGDRVIVVPSFIMGKLKIEDFISESGIASAFTRAMKKYEKDGYERFKFHSLRHFYASWMHLAGYPDKYIMKLGGWEDVTTLQRIYQHALPDAVDEIRNESAEMAEKMFKNN